MNTIDMIKTDITALFHTHPEVHINVTVTRPKKLTFHNQPAFIKGVYPHVFQIEEWSSGSPKCYSYQYADVLTGNIEIIEITDRINKIRKMSNEKK